MKPLFATRPARRQSSRTLMVVAACSAALLAAPGAHAFTPLQQPAAGLAVPANVLFTPSVEWPTGLQKSYNKVDFNPAFPYQGYFDPLRCYEYRTTQEYFQPLNQLVNASGNCGVMSTQGWSGNLLNWLTATNLDQFRRTMTGGTRDTFSDMSADTDSPGDTLEQTILIKSFSSRGVGSPDDLTHDAYKFLTGATPGFPKVATPALPWPSNPDLAVRTAGYGTKMLIRNRVEGTSNENSRPLTAVFPNMDDRDNQKKSCATANIPAGFSCYNIRVRVCDATDGKTMESNCNPNYSGAAKPEGLIQQYADRLRYGVVTYLNHDTQARNGAVVRAPMRSVGAEKATATSVVPNNEPEWDLTTGIFKPNPTPADALNSSTAGVPITASGVINYLNGFGYTAKYKSYDPVAELYYAALLYLRGIAPPEEYARITSDRLLLLDGFPAVTGPDLLAGASRDPILNTCQKNYIVGLSDYAPFCDGSLPGSTFTSDCTESFSLAEESLNVQTLWSNVALMENLPGGKNAPNGWRGGDGAGDTPYMAGLAHWAHTKDIRQDLTGDQHVETFWIDVLQNNNNLGSSSAAIRLKTPAWLAAKYGGFDKKLAGSNNPNDNLASWDSDNNGVPNNFFAGNDPLTLRAGLASVFSRIATDAAIGTASAPAVSQRIEGPGTLIFSASYDPTDWTGELRACLTSQTAEECRKSPVWNASDWLRPENAPVNGITPLKPAERKIITAWRNSATGAFAKSPFLYSPPGPSINSAQRALINGDDSEEFGKLALAFLRGDRSREGRELRRRGPHALASIVNSNITYLGRSTERYSGPNFQGNLLNQDHKTYRDSTSNRAPVVYVGANDGKLHAFDATNGKELFAYVPGSMFFNDKLNAQVQPEFSHQYMLDSTPMVGDFQNSSNSNRWGTLLVGGLGGGGRGFYALNITRQGEFAGMNENLLASELPLWEFTSAQDSDLGYTFNEPAQDSASGRFLQIAKVASASVATGSWVVTLGNGYGSTNGKAVLYLLNAATGVAQHKLEVPAIITSNGEPPPANGLSTPTPVDTDGDGLVDTIYAGDLLGYVHKFAYTRTQGTGNAAKWVLGTPGTSAGDTAWRYIGAVFRAVDNAGNPQPITTAIAVGPRCGAAGGLALSVGTGKLLERTDVTSTSPQMFFTFFDTGAVTPGSPKTPLLAGPENLATLTTEQGRTTASGLDIRNWAAPTGTTAAEGWKMPLQAGERVLGNATLPPDTGAVVFGVTQPSANTCEAGEGGYVVAVDLCSGSTTTLTFDGQLVGAFKVGTSGVVKVAPGYRMLDGKLFAGSNQRGGPTTSAPTTGSLTDNLAPPGRYSWREVLGF